MHRAIEGGLADLEDYIAIAATPPVPADWREPQLGTLAAGPARPGRIARLFHVSQVIEDKPSTHRLAMSNVIACLNKVDVAMVYMLSSSERGVGLYLGVAGDRDASVSAGKLLERSFSGNFLGAKVDPVDHADPAHAAVLDHLRHVGLVHGVPSCHDSEGQSAEEELQGVERLVNSLAGEAWTLAVVAQAGEPAEIVDMIDQLQRLAGDLASHAKFSLQRSRSRGIQHSRTEGTNRGTSRGEDRSRSRNSSVSKTEGFSEDKDGGRQKSGSSSTSSDTGESSGTNASESSGTSTSDTQGGNSGTSEAVTTERIDKASEALAGFVDEVQLPRFRQGHAKGMFRTAVYVCAAQREVYQRLAHSVVSIFQGNKASMTPLRVHEMAAGSIRDLGELLAVHDHVQSAPPQPAATLVHSLAVSRRTGRQQGATWLNGDELSLLMGFPGREVPGIRIRKSVDFGLNLPEGATDAGIRLGSVVQHGRSLPFQPVVLQKDELAKHIFITGVTGSGKTTTCMKLLLESQLPFLVIEPAKTEYRELHGMDPDIEYYTLGREDLTPFRLNPFELVSERSKLSSHVDILKNTLNAVYPMEAAMPYIVEEAIIQAYRRKGWDIHASSNYLVDDPFAPHSGAWPTFADMIAELDAIIVSKDMGQEFREKYRGSLVARLSNLTHGTKGRMLNCRASIDFDALLDKKVVIELDEIKDESDKALFMGLIISRLAECMKLRHAADPAFRHLTLVEEAHRLLARPEPGEGSRKLGVDMFCNLLAEVRKYGEGLIVADQIPGKLVDDVIKNTNTKIVHRLFSADDRDVIGDAMCLDERQKDHLPALQPGEAVVYGGGWHAPVLARVERNADTNGAVIGDEELRLRGGRQVWEARHWMYPHQARTGAFADGASLLAFQRDAAPVWSLGLRLLHDRIFRHHENGPTIGGERIRLLERAGILARRLAGGWEARLAGSGLAGALAAQFFDDHGLDASEDGAVAVASFVRWLLADEPHEFGALAKLDGTLVQFKDWFNTKSLNYFI